MIFERVKTEMEKYVKELNSLTDGKTSVGIYAPPALKGQLSILIDLTILELIKEDNSGFVIDVQFQFDENNQQVLDVTIDTSETTGAILFDNGSSYNVEKQEVEQVVNEIVKLIEANVEFLKSKLIDRNIIQK